MPRIFVVGPLHVLARLPVGVRMILIQRSNPGPCLPRYVVVSGQPKVG